MIIVVLTNVVNGPALLHYTGIAKLLNKVNKDKDKFKCKKGESKPDFSEIIGYYEHHFGVPLFSQIGSRLVALEPMEIDPAEMLTIYDTKADGVFTAPKNFSFDSPGEDIHFEGDSIDDRVFVDSHGGRSARFKLEY